MSFDCPLCRSINVIDFSQDKRRCYFRCQICALVFVDPHSHLTCEQEKAIYQYHQNQPDDLGYQGFLNRLAAPLSAKLGASKLQGLDFGCGPGPVLATMLRQAGYSMHCYDPYFAPDAAALAQQYDFITCTEAIEHFYHPAKEWALLLSLLKPCGWLGIMTKLVIDFEAFRSWHYKNDPTHVSFFSRDTFCFLAARDGLDVDFVGNDVILLRKKTV